MNKISVVIPCHNAESTLLKSVESVLTQTYPVSEILIYNDGSSDGTLTLLNRLKSTYPVIKIWSGEKSLGAGFARNFLLNKVASDFVAFLDSDDNWVQTKLAKQMAIMDQDPNVVIVFSGYDIYIDSHYLGSRRPFPKVNFWTMHIANWIPMSTALLRFSACGSSKMPVMRRRQDYAYWLSILKNNPQGTVKGHPESLLIYNRSLTSLSASKLNNLKFNYKVFRESLNYSPVSSCFFVFFNVISRVFRK